jgi:hypothetical protein
MEEDGADSILVCSVFAAFRRGTRSPPHCGVVRFYASHRSKMRGPCGPTFHVAGRTNTTVLYRTSILYVNVANLFTEFVS